MRTFERSAGVMRGHGPSSCARRAASMARSTSWRPARGTVVMVVPLEGFFVSKVWPSAESTNSPSMKSWYWRMTASSGAGGWFGQPRWQRGYASVIRMGVVREGSAGHLVSERRHRPGDLRAEVRVRLGELGVGAVIQAEKVGQHQDLAVTMWSSPDPDGGRTHGLGDLPGQ